MWIVAGYGLLMGLSLSGYLYLRKKKKTKYRKYLLVLAATGMICMVTGICERYREQPELSQLKRNEAGAGNREAKLYLDAEGLFQDYEYTVSVTEQQLTEKEAEQIFERAMQVLEHVILGENQSPDAVSSDLKIPDQLLEGLVQVSCSFDPADLVDPDGTIRWENQKESSTMVKVTAEMTCQDREAEEEFYLQLTAKEPEDTRLLLREIDRRIGLQNQAQGQESIALPEEINGIRLSWHAAEEKNHGRLLLLSLAGMAAWYVYQKEKREREQKERDRKLILDYPDIVSRLSLLTGAGMTLPAAWSKIAAEYRTKKDKGYSAVRPGYEEMLRTWYEIQDGTGEIQAYENFGRRCGQTQYRKFASMLIQNVRKGARGMQQLLDAEAEEAFRQRKAYAKQLGEEAGTKLLIPMGIMLVLVFAILMLPALLSLNL